MLVSHFFKFHYSHCYKFWGWLYLLIHWTSGAHNSFSQQLLLLENVDPTVIMENLGYVHIITDSPFLNNIWITRITPFPFLLDLIKLLKISKTFDLFFKVILYYFNFVSNQIQKLSIENFSWKCLCTNNVFVIILL